MTPSVESMLRSNMVHPPSFPPALQRTALLSVLTVIFSCKGTIPFKRSLLCFTNSDQCFCQKRNEPLPIKHPVSNNGLPLNYHNST